MEHGWSKADIHIHTTYSDGAASVAEVVEYAATKTDLRVIAITDHDTIAGALEARRIAEKYDLEVIVGEEISTSDGHLLALFLEQQVAPRMSVAATIAAVHAQGGICIAAHPYDWPVPSLGWAGLHERCTSANPEWAIDAFETFNASLLFASSNRKAAMHAERLAMAMCAGSDSHHLPTIGLGYTLFPGQTAQDLRYAIRMRTVRPCGRSWRAGHMLEVVGLRLRAIRQRAFQRPLAST